MTVDSAPNSAFLISQLLIDSIPVITTRAIHAATKRMVFSWPSISRSVVLIISWKFSQCFELHGVLTLALRIANTTVEQGILRLFHIDNHANTRMVRTFCHNRLLFGIAKRRDTSWKTCPVNWFISFRFLALRSRWPAVVVRCRTQQLQFLRRRFLGRLIERFPLVR